MSIRERIDDWRFVRKIRPDDPNLNRLILALHWRHMSDEEAIEFLHMDSRTFRRYKKAYREMGSYLSC